MSQDEVEIVATPLVGVPVSLDEINFSTLDTHKGRRYWLVRVIKPFWAARATASVRLVVPSLPMIELTWNLAVRSLMIKWASISLLGIPCARSASTSSSRSVRASYSAGGLAGRAPYCCPTWRRSLEAITG